MNGSIKHSKKNRKFSDFTLIKVIGMGTFGKVYLALLDGTPYALKCMIKSELIEMKQTDHILQEKKLQSNMEHPFIVKLYAPSF